MQRLRAAEQFSSGVCNLSCKYCYIPKSEEMYSLHKEIVEKIKNGDWLESLEAAYGEELEFLGLWGTEPTSTLDLIPIEVALRKFPKLKNISFSTNMMADVYSIKRFIEKMQGVGKEIEFKCQISIDGPAFITDINRSEGAAAKIPENFLNLVRKLNKISFDKVKVRFDVKATLSLDNIRMLNREPEKIKEYFDYFDGIEKAFKHINKHKNVTFNNCCSPTLMVPGKYSSDDGKDLAKFFELLREKKYPNTYIFRLKRIFDYQFELATKPSMFSCSGGDSNLGIGIKDDLHICHRSFFFNYQEYIDSILKGTGTKNWDVSLFEEGRINLINNNFIVDSKNEKDKTRFLYVMRNYHDFWRLKISYSVAMLKELIACGQASKVYLNNDLAVTLGLFMNIGLSCPMENLLNTGIVHFSPVSTFRLFANGAFEVILRQVLEQYKNKTRERGDLHALVGCSKVCTAYDQSQTK